jgi:hypothetical protein
MLHQSLQLNNCENSALPPVRAAATPFLSHRPYSSWYHGLGGSVIESHICFDKIPGIHHHEQNCPAGFTLSYVPYQMEMSCRRGFCHFISCTPQRLYYTKSVMSHQDNAWSSRGTAAMVGAIGHLESQPTPDTGAALFPPISASSVSRRESLLLAVLLRLGWLQLLQQKIGASASSWPESSHRRFNKRLHGGGRKDWPLRHVSKSSKSLQLESMIRRRRARAPEDHQLSTARGSMYQYCMICLIPWLCGVEKIIRWISFQMDSMH